MRIEYLKEFQMLAETLSFTETARSSYISQSVLSKHIVSMEKELGCPLVDRSPAGVKLTEAGKLFYADTVSVIDDYQRAVGNIEQLRTRRGKTLTIGYLRDASKPLLSPILRWFNRYHPDVDLQLVSMHYDEIGKALRNGSVDVIITMDDKPDPWQHCVVYPIYADRLVVAVPGWHDLAQEESISLSMLKGEHLLIPNASIWPGIRNRLEQLLPPKTMRDVELMNDVDTLFLLIESGNGIAIVASHNKYVYAPKVAFRPLRDVASDNFPVSAVWLDSTEADPLKAKCLGYFKRALDNAMKGLAPEDRLPF